MSFLPILLQLHSRLTKNSSMKLSVLYSSLQLFEQINIA